MWGGQGDSPKPFITTFIMGFILSNNRNTFETGANMGILAYGSLRLMALLWHYSSVFKVQGDFGTCPHHK